MEETITRRLTVSIRGGVLRDIHTGQSVVIDGEPCVIGRGKKCRMSIDNRELSRVHCEVRGTEQGVRVIDMGSTNGTLVGDVIARPKAPVWIFRATRLQLAESTLLQFSPNDDVQVPVIRQFGENQSRSPAMLEALTLMHKAAEDDTEPVLLLGGSGTGKSYFAQEIHRQGPRADKPFIVIDCATLNPNLIESELFGHERGAFTGAVQQKRSPFILAGDGTIFLDEVGELPLHVQSRLLRVVATGLVKPVGSTSELKVRARIIAATKHPLLEWVNDKQFRDDLYFRLAALPIEIPPLRERMADMELLIKQIFARMDRPRPEAYEAITQDDFAWLRKQEWQGQVRQLEQVFRIAVRAWRGGKLDLASAYHRNLGGAGRRKPSPSVTPILQALSVNGMTEAAVTVEAWRALYTHLLESKNGRYDKMERAAEVSHVTLRKRLRALGLYVAKEKTSE